MRIAGYLRFVFVAIFISISLFAQKVWLVDPLQEIYPDKNSLSDYGGSWEAAFPDNSFATVHVVIEGMVAEKIEVSAMCVGKELPLSYWNILQAVPVSQNTGTGIKGRTERFLGKKNPDVVRDAPFNIYEVIRPLKNNFVISKDKFTALRFFMPTDKLLKGMNIINISVRGKGWQKKLIFKAMIGKSVPSLKNSQFLYINTFASNRMTKKHHLTRGTKQWWDMLRKYARLLARCRQNCIQLPSNLLFSYKDGVISLNEKKALVYINVFRKEGFTYFESPHLFRKDAQHGTNALFVVVTGHRYDTVEGKNDVGSIACLLKDFIIKNHLSNCWLQHIADEPNVGHAVAYKAAAMQMKKICPQIKIIEATKLREPLIGAVDFWCPLIHNFQTYEKFYRSREKYGEKVLVYTCLVPGGKWLNRTLDMERLRQVYFGWAAAKYNTFGYLHWGLNWYRADPFKMSVVKHHSPLAGPNNYLPAGDTHIIYPGEDRPLSSLRLEAYRVGIEDYELLQLLKKRDKKMVDKYIAELFSDYTHYCLSLKQYRKIRKELVLGK